MDVGIDDAVGEDVNVGLSVNVAIYLQEIVGFDVDADVDFSSCLDYCDITYHIPSKQDQFGEIVNSQMKKKLKESNTKQHWLLLGHNKAQLIQNPMKNLSENPCLSNVDVGDFYGSTRS